MGPRQNMDAPPPDVEEKVSAGETQDMASHPREIEVKITNLGDPDKFIEKIKVAGGTLLHKRRLLRDTALGLPKGEKNKTLETAISIKLESFKDPSEAKAALEFLGLEFTRGDKEKMTALVKRPLPNRTVRIRQDGDEIFLTIKEKRDEEEEIADRIEREAIVQNFEEVFDLLKSLGYTQKSIREKYRTTYELEGVLVELNEGPMGKPWAEIEGHSKEAVAETASKLDYEKSDLANISDAAYYSLQRIPKTALKHFVFQKPHEH